MASPERAPEHSDSQMDDTSLQHVSALLGRDLSEFFQEMLREEERARAQLRTGFQAAMRSEARRLRSFQAFEPCRSWSPQELAAAGFFYAGAQHRAVQCFCCGLALFHSSFRRSPLQEHQKLRPGCAFLAGTDVGNIAKYDVRVQQPPSGGAQAGPREEAARLASFQDWPFYAHTVSPRLLAAAGFAFTGNRKQVQAGFPSLNGAHASPATLPASSPPLFQGAK